MKTRSKEKPLVAASSLPTAGEEDEDYGDVDSGIDEDALEEDDLDTDQVVSEDALE